MRKGPQDVASLDVPAGHERQAFEADHRVASPVGEPVITGDDGAYFIALRAGAGGLFGSTRRGDDELVSGEHEFRRNAISRVRHRMRRQVASSVALCFERLLGLERAHRVERLRRGDQRGTTASLECEAEIPGTPEIALRLIAAALF